MIDRSSMFILLVAGLAAINLHSVAGVVSANESDSEKPGDGVVAARFKQLDKNNDERLSKGELGEGLFRELNVNGDEFVTLDEAQSEIRKRGFAAVLKAAQQGSSTKSSARKGKDDATLRQGPKRIAAADHGIGQLIPDLKLTDYKGRTKHLTDFGDARVIVIAFANTTCPICKKFAPTLAALERQLVNEKVQFIFVNSSAAEKDPAIESMIQSQGFKGPYVRDVDGSIATSLGATRTTDVFVLDSRRTLIYRGAVDDQYGFEYSLDAPRIEYARLAIRSVLDNRPLLITATEAPGCPIERSATATTNSEVTYHNRISRIIQSQCLECHRSSGPAPFPLDSYENVVAQAGAIRLAVVDRGVMPPWFASPPAHGEPSLWANDRSLADSEKADLRKWLDNGKPVGNPNDAPLAKVFPDGWRIGQPDFIVQLPEPQKIKATGVMPYQNIVVDSGLTEDKWVKAMEIRPTATEVVHHVLVFVLPPRSAGGGDRRGDDEEDGFFAAYAPGNDAVVFAEGFGKKLPAGSRFKFQLHYTPNGTATEDQSRMALIFSDKEPDHVVQITGIANPRLSIPPGAENHEVKASRTVPTDATIYAFFPHMHLRGKAFRYEAVLPDGRTQLLLDVPRYDFNWQLSYRLAEPIELPKGTTLQLTGWYDNSKNNPANPDPTRTVKWGPQTFDEMMLGYIEYTAETSLGRQIGGLGQGLETIFRQLDRDKDGKLVGDELPADWKERLLKLDADKDGAVSLEEIQHGIRRRRSD